MMVVVMMVMMPPAAPVTMMVMVMMMVRKPRFTVRLRPVTVLGWLGFQQGDRVGNRLQQVPVRGRRERRGWRRRGLSAADGSQRRRCPKKTGYSLVHSPSSKVSKKRAERPLT
jgi:hypothetical protein